LPRAQPHTGRTNRANSVKATKDDNAGGGKTFFLFETKRYEMSTAYSSTHRGRGRVRPGRRQAVREAKELCSLESWARVLLV